MTGAVIVGLAVAAAFRYPWLLSLGVIPALARCYRRSARRREANRQNAFDLVLAARTLLVALAAGMSLPAAIAVASGEVGREVGAELDRVRRVARRQGAAAALADSDGRLTRPLLSRLAFAQASGAPMSEAVAAFLTETRTTRRAEALERVRRLPVTLMIPLGLLILPGFVVLFVGPIVVGSMIDLFGALP